MKKVALAAALAACAVGCGSESSDGGGGPSDVPDGVRDVRVAIPEPDEAFVDIVTPDVIIEPGEEKMYCLHMVNEEGDLAVGLMDTTQGDYGHHFVALTTLDPQPPGTLEDCTDESEMWKYRAFVLPDTELPEGHATEIPAGLPYVMQFHYVNTGKEPILVRDLARMHKVSTDEVTTWVSTFTTNALDFELEPRKTSSISFDCTLPEATELLVLGGHMHEFGSRFEAAFDKDGSGEFETLYEVTEWKDDFRDAPPVSLFFEQPRVVPAGTVVRTSCEFDNNSDTMLGFPEEMCSTFGYLAGTKEPFHCESGK